MYRIESKEVSAALRLSVHPLLRTAGGFTKLKARGAWRFDEHTTSVVDFASFSPSRAASMGCTTFSFSVQLGVFFDLALDEDRRFFRIQPRGQISSPAK